MKIKYINKNFRSETLSLIENANDIIENYSAQGFSLTLRQLYYQFVANNLFPEHWADKETGSTNNERSYKKLGNIINDARLAGLIDWENITDRTREIKKYTSWNSVSEILYSASESYSLNKWRDQPVMCEVWVEKDALIDVVKRACATREVPYFSCRGYVSQSAMWRASQRIYDYHKPTYIFYLGDHDPSGLDMDRDIEDRLRMFEAEECTIVRGALNKEQIKMYSPPPNPTKVTDSRAPKYIKEHGYECWELDALEPQILVDLIEEFIEYNLEEDLYDEIIKQEVRDQKQIHKLAWEFQED